MKKINIGYFADGPWAHNAFELINKDSRFNISFICVRYDSEDAILRQRALEFDIDYLKHRNINSEAFIEQIKVYQCDIFVSMSFNQIFKKQIINLPPLKTINCHAGMLPYYRGRNILNWVLINDEKAFGITVHYVDQGIDTGDIILQKKFPISDQDTYQTLLEVAYVECANVLYQSLELVIEKKVKRICQSDIHPLGLYCGMRTVGDEIIDWNQTSRELFNFIRALCYPGPKAQTKLNGMLFKINRAIMIPDAIEYKGIPGQVVGKSDEGIVIKTKDTTILVTEYECEKKVRVGDRLV